MKIKQIYDDRVFADLQYHDKVGLMKLNELKIILSNGESESESWWCCMTIFYLVDI